MQFFQKNKIKQYVIPIALCLSLTACGTKEYTNQEQELVSVNESLYEGYIETIDEETGPLLNHEMQALLSIGEIDKSITAEQLKLIETEYKHYIKNPKGRVTIERFMYRALPYLDYTKQVFRERNMPEELAYLAFVESGYNPWARSWAGAVGMWQFMSATGRHCGLTQNWWVDERRDPYKSTIAAAKYLQEMYDEFGDWLLALAAYNAGPGKIRRALAETNTDNFFDLMKANESIENEKLKIKTETQIYVPRFLAMAKIMRNFDKLGFVVKENELGKGHKVIEEKAVAIKAQPGTDLRSVAKHLDLSWNEFLNYNPAYLRDVTPFTGTMHFYVPVSLEAEAQKVSKMTMIAGWSTYRIKRGDTLSGISKKTGVPIQVLRQANTISEPLRIGVELRIPASNTYMASRSMNERPNNPTNYKVKSGDTFGEIANRYGLSTRELQKANPQIRDIRKLALGQEIYIPGLKEQKNKTQVIAQKQETSKKVVEKKQVIAQKSSVETLTEQTKQVQSRKSSTTYTLKAGDTLYSIAKMHGMSVENLQAINDNLDPTTLSVGQVINIKGTPKRVQTVAQAKKTYTVQKGDTLFSIARNHGVTVYDLRDVNTNISNSLSIGQKIYIPSNAKKNTIQASVKARVHIVKKGDTLYSIGRSYNVSVEAIMAYNNMKANSLSIGQKLRIPNPDNIAEADI